MKNKIEELILKGDQMSEQDVSSLVTWIKKQLETMPQADREKFSILKMYCDWHHHHSVDTSKTGLRILKKINDALCENKKRSVDANILAVSTSIGLGVLKSEMRGFLESIGLETQELDSYWSVFIGHLMELINQSTIEFPKNIDTPRQKMINDIKASPLKAGMWVIAATPININGKRHLMILTSDTTRIIVPLTMV